MASSSSNTIFAVLVAYALFCFTVPPTTSTIPNLRGGLPSLYMKVAVCDIPRVRGDAAAVAARGMQEVDHDEPHGETHAFIEVMSALLAMMVLADRLPPFKSPTRVATTGFAVLILYAMVSFGIQATMTVTPHLRGCVPSLYMQPTLHAIGGLRGSAVAVTENDMPKVDEGDESLCTFAFVEVLGVLVSIFALASTIPHRRSPTCMTTTCSAILIAYALFSFAMPSSMNTTPYVRGGIPTLYVQPALGDGGGLRGSAISVTTNEMLHLGQDEASLGTFAEVLAVVLSIMALAHRIPQSRSPSGTAITGSAILIAYTLFCFGIPPTLSLTPYVRGGIPSLYMKPVSTSNSGLRGVSVGLAQNGMKSNERDEAHYEWFSDLTDTISESFGPMGYCAALSVPALAMTYLTQRKEHSKIQ